MRVRTQPCRDSGPRREAWRTRRHGGEGAGLPESTGERALRASVTSADIWITAVYKGTCVQTRMQCQRGFQTPSRVIEIAVQLLSQ